MVSLLVFIVEHNSYMLINVAVISDKILIGIHLMMD